MRSLLFSITRNFLLVTASLLVCAVTANIASAQCDATAPPTYAHSCSDEYFESINITGAGVTSTVYVTGVTSCRGTYINDYPWQGTTAPIDSAVSVNITKYAAYAAFLSVYIDWNNDGAYETSELAGTMLSLTDTTSDITYNFTVPATAVTGTNLHMRLFLSEDSTGAPCSGSYGQTYDFFLIVGSGCTMPVLAVRPNTPDTVSTCPGGVGIAISTSGVGMSGTFTWAPAAGLTATTGSSVTANPSTTTVYTISGTSTGTCTATYLDTVTVLSTGYPADTILYTGPYVFCAGDSALLTGTTGPGYHYQWFNSGMASHYDHSNTYLATTSGMYTLVINAYGCIDTSAAVTLSFNTGTVPVISASGMTLYTGSSFTSYQWYDNSVAIPGATTDSFTATTAGNYNVLVTDTTGCPDSATYSYTISTLGVNNIVNAASIAIYPNPASNMINIVAPVTVNAIITGIEGEMIIKQNAARAIGISRLAPGIYFIELYDEQGNKLAVKKIIKN